MDEEGYVSLPEGPGLGVEVDEASVIEAGKDTERKFTWSDSRLKDGSVADY
jgi:galactonate dehydratase